VRRDKNFLKCTTHDEVIVHPSPEKVVPDIAFGRAVELVTGVSCINLSHKRTCSCGYYRKRKRKLVRQKEQLWKSGDWRRTQKAKKKKKFTFPHQDSSSKIPSPSLGGGYAS
jgi:hypothetical protein